MNIKFRRFGYVRERRYSDVYRRIVGYPNLIKRLQARDVMAALSLRSSDRVLDLGCGYGFVTVEMAKIAREAVGVDISSPRAGNSIPIGLQDRLRFLTVDGRSLPFDDNYFDTVLASEVLMMIADPNEFIAEIRRILKPGGRLVVVNWTGHSAIEEAYQQNSAGLRLAKAIARIDVPPTYKDYTLALQTFFATAFPFRSAAYYREVLTNSGFSIESETRSPTDLVAAACSWNQFFHFVRTGRPNPSRFFFVKYLLFGMLGWLNRNRTIGGQILVGKNAKHF